MSSVGYDMDTSGGLMPLIRALIKPPDEDANGQKNKKPQHPYYKRPGKGHNHDSCDACGEGGDLICCDRCPASFHLGCYDPPLEESDIPVGQWLCKECEAAQSDKPASSRSSRAHSPVDSKSDTEKRTRTLRNNRTNSLAKKRSRDDVKEEEEEKNMQEEKPLTPMEVLVNAAKIMNPKQFELPRDMRVPCPFPGTEKEGGNGKNGNGGVVSVDAWGCVPPPARLCFACGATCKHAPLLQCDYCPLLFHQDCLDPPLTALPTGRWMCPNHVEQYIDYKLVNSISATERVALWDKFSGPVDQHAIRIDFIRRARNRHPPFRVKVPVGVKGRVVVPAMVRYHYQNPPPLMPSRREYVRCRNVLRNQKYSEDPDASTDDEDLDIPPESKHKICMNISCPQYTGEGRCEHSSTTLKGASASDAAEDLDAINRSQVEGGSESSELSDSDFEYLASPVKRRRVSSDEGAAAARRGGGRGARAARGCLPLRVDGDAEGLLAAVDRQLRKLDDRLVKLLAWQRLQQVLSGEQCWGSFRGAPLSAAAAAAVRRSVDRVRLARHGYRHVPLPSELLSAGDRARIAAAVWGAPPPPRRARAASPGHSLSAAAVRATLCPVQSPASHGLGDGLGRPIPMRLSRLIVGSDSSCDVVLDPGRCRYVSPHHATIFMDEVTRHFELINYSEWGSRVNGVLYACEVSRPADADADADAAEDRARLVREIVAARMPKPVRVNGALSCGPAPTHACRCAPAPAPPAAAAWEGSALVPHGALLQFGCLMYVFSILDAPGFPYESSVETPAL